MIRVLSLLFFVLLLATSCRTRRPLTDINYLQDMRDTTIRDSIGATQSLIRKGDLLSIRVFSTSNGVEPRVDAPYNLEVMALGTVPGYLVDQAGNIEYPQLGVLKAEGLSREQLADLIKQKLGGQLNQPSVIVRFLNYRVTVLGEVRTPGTFTFTYEKVTILEALGMAGDLTEYGKKKGVKVIRERDGQREFGTVDLTSNDMFNSPFFRLQQNDIVVVDQSGRRSRLQEQQNLATQIGIGTSILAALALVFNFIR